MTSFLHYLFLVLLALGGLCILTITLVTALGWLMLRGHEFQDHDHDHDLDEPPTSRWARPEPRQQADTVILPYPRRPANGTATLARQRHAAPVHAAQRAHADSYERDADSYDPREEQNWNNEP